MPSAPIRRQQGMTLIEQITIVVIMGILLMLATRAFSAWIQNLRIRAAAESLHNALLLTRSEAIKQNTRVQFSLVDQLGSGCSYIAINSDVAQWRWVFSTIDPVTNSCPSAGNNTGVIQTAGSEEGRGGSDIRLRSTAASLIFNGLSRVSSAATFQVSAGGSAHCGSAAESVRCLNVQVAFPGGQVRMCDPAVTDTSDPRKCL